MDIFSYVRPVNYYETDQMGIVHHSNYIRWMEEARLAAMETIGLSYAKVEEMGILIPVLSASCNYRLPFRYGEEMEVQVTPSVFNGIKMEISYRIVDPKTKTLHADGKTSHCFVDRNMKLVRLKKEYLAIYEPLAEWAKKIEEKE